MRRRISTYARIGVARGLWGAALAVVLTPGTASALRHPAATAIVLQDGTTPAGVRRRPFEHQRHESLPCRGCHGAGATHRTTRVRAPRDCAACHHDPARAIACITCHRVDRLPAERLVRLSLSLLVVDTGRTREVLFRHGVHVAPAAGLSCRDCHATEVTLQRNRECGSCHESHHSERTNCAACHAAPRKGAHNASVHLSCAGSACHASNRAPPPTISSAACLFCHADRRDHEPGGACALCHRIPGGSRSRGTGARGP